MTMRYWTCSCKWSFVVGKRRVFGAVMEDGNASGARMMTRKTFNFEYADCAARLDSEVNTDRKVHPWRYGDPS